MELGSSSSSTRRRRHHDSGRNMINSVLSQLGISFVPDRSACSLKACGTAVCQQVLRKPREVGSNARKRSYNRPAGTTEEAAGGACSVCQDLATGCHYGAVTCDWCKQFFEQSVRSHYIYDCLFNRECDLKLQRRNHCQACRWDRCLEVGMAASAVCKRRVLEGRSGRHHRTRQLSHQEAEELLLTTQEQAAATGAGPATPQPSLPSPTETGSSQYDCWDDDEADRRSLVRDLLGGHRRCPELPIGAGLVRDALTPLESPETLGARATELERSCLVELFRWNKRRLDSSNGGGGGGACCGNFGAAAANWMPILLASALRHYLASSQVAEQLAAAPSASCLRAGESFTAELTGRLKRLLRGKEFDFEPLMDKIDCQLSQLGALCCRLVEAVLELRQDALGDLILLMGDQTEPELSSSLQSPVLLAILSEISATADALHAGRAEQRALLLASLACGPEPAVAAEDNSATKRRRRTFLSDDDDYVKVPALFGI